MYVKWCGPAVAAVTWPPRNPPGFHVTQGPGHNVRYSLAQDVLQAVDLFQSLLCAESVSARSVQFCSISAGAGKKYQAPKAAHNTTTA